MKLVPIRRASSRCACADPSRAGLLEATGPTRDAFDDEGFYKPGDAVRFADPSDAAKGILFDGRLAEDFKLTTGTWVQVGAVRVGALTACSPVLQDLAIVAGEGPRTYRCAPPG